MSAKNLRQQLRELREVQADPAWKQKVLYSLIGETPKVSSYRPLVWRFSITAGTVAFAVLLMANGAVQAVEQSLPGTAFYPVKLSMEQWRTRMAGPHQKMQLEVEFAVKRLDEVHHLMQNNNVNSTHVSEGMKRFADQLGMIIEQLDKKELRQDVNTVKVARMMNQKTGQIKDVINKQSFDPETSKKMQQNLQEAQKTSQQMQEKTLAAVIEDYKQVNEQKASMEQDLASLIDDNLAGLQEKLAGLQEKMSVATLEDPKTQEQQKVIEKDVEHVKKLVEEKAEATVILTKIQEADAKIETVQQQLKDLEVTPAAEVTPEVVEEVKTEEPAVEQQEEVQETVKPAEVVSQTPAVTEESPKEETSLMNN